jgi:hypothetical protein
MIFETGDCFPSSVAVLQSKVSFPLLPQLLHNVSTIRVLRAQTFTRNSHYTVQNELALTVLPLSVQYLQL